MYGEEQYLMEFQDIIILHISLHIIEVYILRGSRRKKNQI